MDKDCLGLGKTLFNSSVCLLSPNRDIELLLTERLTRKKASGAWPEKALLSLAERRNLSNVLIAENRDVLAPSRFEAFLDSQFPFFEHLKTNNLSAFSQNFNPEIKWISHHLSHAYAAMMMSPFEKALIVVVDGAGSNAEDFPQEHPERPDLASFKGYRPHEKRLEESTAYLFDRGQLKCVKKNWQVFKKSESSSRHWISEGLGSLYEKSAEFIFNDKRAAGKVMGLAALGRGLDFEHRSYFLEGLDWSKAFSEKGKKDWENSPHLSYYSDIAASVQLHFEKSLTNMIEELHRAFPEYENLILTGGCALNCTTNMKIFKKGIFNAIYVPPFPGDESIGLGAASYLFHEVQKNSWQRRSWEDQHGYFGAPSSTPTEEGILKYFSGFKIERCESIEKKAAQVIAADQVIGWYQGRSETGPRALGNRSILARVDRPNLKNYLNADIKMRESFRPYGCSIIHERAHEFFDIPQGFENPFMSFAVDVRSHHKDLLKEVTHFDGTSRMQTVRKTQNPRYHALLMEIGALTGTPCALNTSLNVMGEPILESLEDARNFLLKVPVDGLAIGDYYITKGSP